MSTYMKDLLERCGWTAAEALVGVLAVEAASWPSWAGVLVATLAAVVKAGVARSVGNPESAALRPGEAFVGAGGEVWP